MNFSRPNETARRFAPRIVIYLVLILIAAWWMTKWDKTRQIRTGSVHQPPASEEIQATSDGADSELPLMVVVSVADDSLREVVAEAQRRHEGRCRIVLLSTGTDTAGVQKVFQADELPVAILYNKDNKEIIRKAGPITADVLDSLLPDES